MNHFEVITASKTWTCPKTGIYKIIAVGGGSSSAFSFAQSSASKMVCASGGNTTFGTKLTAIGGANPVYISSIANGIVFGGAGGYTLQNYGGEGALYLGSQCVMPPTLNGGAPGIHGRGYGAGGANSKYFSSGVSITVSGNRRDMSVHNLPNKAGELNELICDISVNESIACTIGAGGALSAAVVSSAIKTVYSFSDSEYTAQTALVEATSAIIANDRPGKSGCIVIEYLGESY